MTETTLNPAHPYPGAQGRYSGRDYALPSAWGWHATEPQLHTHRQVEGAAPGVTEAFDPRTDGEIDYEVLRDTLIAAFNPDDDDVAEPKIMTDAIDTAFSFIVAQPCHCPPLDLLQDHASDITVTDYYGLQCARCVALGRSNDRRVER